MKAASLLVLLAAACVVAANAGVYKLYRIFGLLFELRMYLRAGARTSGHPKPDTFWMGMRHITCGV